MTKHFTRVTRGRIAGLGFAAILVSAPGLVSAQAAAQAASPTGEAAETAETPAAETMIQKWPKKLQSEAKMLIERYGQPSSFDENRLTWLDNGPWRRTVLHREGLTRSFMGKGKDHLEQVISREVPLDKVADLEKFDKRIKVDRAAGEISTCADSERLNFLALNLAEDIITGQRSVTDARAFAVKVRTLEKAGKSSPYLDGLVFTKQEAKPSESEPMTPEKTGTPPVYDDTPKP